MTTSRTYLLAPLEKSGVARPQVLVIKTPSHTYYVEYRQPIGQDAFLSQYPSATNSVQISVSAAFGVDTGPFALDFTPDSKTSAGAYDWYDAPLAMGRSFSNPGRTFTVSPVSHNGTAATVKISFA